MANISRIGIIGGGAAGIMAAATILESNSAKQLEVHLFEKNKTLGVKVAISGGGRCNVTTGIVDKRLLLSKYIRGSKFLAPAFAAFSPAKVKDWFDEHNVPLKIESDLRVFPESDIGQDIVEVFLKIFQDKRMHIHYLEAITNVESYTEGQFKLTSINTEYICDKLIITTGGNAYSHTGSTGDGYAFAKTLGHSISQLGPSLNSFQTQENWCKELSGISFSQASLSATLATGEIVKVKGPMLFTHFGISGPAVFALAAHIAYETINSSKPLVIQFKPEADLDFSRWDMWLQTAASSKGKKLLVNILTEERLPHRFCSQLLTIAQISPDMKGAELNRINRKRLAHLLSGNLEIQLSARRPGDEFVTAGGVELREVDPKTMRSKHNSNLYFAGEVLNIDGLTGGFNLQAAWATGRVAGLAIT